MEMSRGLSPGGEGSAASRTVLVLVGPTASGKTSVALRIASLLDCEIVSADSRQVHSLMSIGTAQPGAAELDQVPHHFIGGIDPAAGFNAGTFGIRGREAIAEIAARGKVPLVVGGSGLYLRSLIDGLFDGPEAEAEVREEVGNLLARIGPAALLEELRKVDPESASRITTDNPRRITRALEVYRLSGQPMSELQRGKIAIPFTFRQAGLRWPRPLLYERINKRVIGMVNGGLVEETRRLLDLGYSPALRSMQAVGYREVVACLEGSLSRKEMIALIQQNTRRFAKRQLTWFRQDARIRWYDLRDEEDLPRVAREIARDFSGRRKLEKPQS